MTGETEQPHQTRSESRKDKIGRFAQLAAVLGFACDPQEKPTSPLRTYRKPISTEGGNGEALLIRQDVGLTRDGQREERILLGVSLGKPGWASEPKSLTELIEKQEREALEKGPFGDLDKEFLKKGGYQRVAKILKRVEEDGYFLGRLERLLEEYQFGSQLLQELIPQIQERFATYPNFENRYDENKDVFFYTQPPKGKKTASVIRFELGPRGLTVEVGRASLTTEAHLNVSSFRRSNPYTVWFPTASKDPQRDKRFQTDNLEKARKMITEALGQLENYLKERF